MVALLNKGTPTLFTQQTTGYTMAFREFKVSTHAYC